MRKYSHIIHQIKGNNDLKTLTKFKNNSINIWGSVGTIAQ